MDFIKDVEVYMFENKDGYYYAIDPHLKNNGNYGFNIYPKVGTRKKSGYIVTERFLLNAFYKFKSRFNMNLRDKYKGSNWNDVDEVIKCAKNKSNTIKEKANLIKLII